MNMTYRCHIPFAIISTKERYYMRLGMVGIIVKNMEESIAFYEFIGLGVKNRYDENYVELESGGIELSLNSKEMMYDIYGFAPENKGDKLELAFELSTINEVDALCESVKYEGYQVFKEPWNAFWGQRYAIIKDPDDNLLCLYCDLKTDAKDG